MMKHLYKLKEPFLILEQTFQYLLTNHCWWLQTKWRLKAAKSKKLHTIGEELIKPCVLQMATTILGNKARNKFDLVPLSINAIQSRTADLSLDILERVISHIKASPLKTFLWLGETTDVSKSNCSQLIALVWYVQSMMALSRRTFFSEIATEAKDVFQFMKDFFSKHEMDI